MPQQGPVSLVFKVLGFYPPKTLKNNDTGPCGGMQVF